MKENQAEAKKMKLATMCRVLRVSPSGYYEWRYRVPSARVRENKALLERIEEIHVASYESYGMPKIWQELRDEGDANFDAKWASVGRNRIARLMRKAGIRGVSRRRGFTITTQRDETNRAAPDLVNRQFVADAPNRLWVGDITYGPTWAGFIFLAIVLDVWSRKQGTGRGGLDRLLRRCLRQRDGRGTRGAVHVHRRLVQPAAPARLDWRTIAERIRATAATAQASS